jgi:imidazolonepropionase-like amidohydrolase
MGTDAAVYPHGRNTEEFHQLTALGMSPLDALKAGTSVDAELLGIQDRIGTLEAGKVFFVMKEGVIYRDDHERR